MKKKIKPIKVESIPDERFSLIKEKKLTMKSSKIFEGDYRLLEELDKVHING